MGFRFRRSLRIAPGVRINLSRSGPSLSVGPRGAKLNFGPRGTRMTVGLPGTGLSYSTGLPRNARSPWGTQEGNPGFSELDNSAPRPQPRLLHLAVKLAAVGAVPVLCIYLLGTGATSLGNGATSSGADGAAAAISTAKASEMTPTGELPVTANTEGTASALVRDTVLVLSTVNIRGGPSRQANVVGIARRLERYSVFGRSGTWVRIGRDTPVGWVGASRLGK